jgi:hypothetical protein
LYPSYEGKFAATITCAVESLLAERRSNQDDGTSSSDRPAIEWSKSRQHPQDATVPYRR